MEKGPCRVLDLTSFMGGCIGWKRYRKLEMKITCLLIRLKEKLNLFRLNSVLNISYLCSDLICFDVETLPLEFLSVAIVPPILPKDANPPDDIHVTRFVKIKGLFKLSLKNGN